MDETDATNKNSFYLIDVDDGISIESNDLDADQSSEFTFNLEDQISIDPVDLPHISNIKSIGCDSNQSSDKASSSVSCNDEILLKINIEKAKPLDYNKLVPLCNSRGDTEGEDTDDKENINYLSEIKKLHPKCYGNEKDIKNKSCCLCLIL